MLKAFYDVNVLENTINSSKNEKDFVASCHSSAGMFIRNQWQLWWNKEAEIKQWNKKQPKLNAWFETIGISHADDISSII